MLNISIMQFHFNLVVLATLFFSSVLHGQSESQEKTIGILNKSFRTFLVSREHANIDGIDQFNYEFPLQGLETDSKQHLKGIAFYLDKKGKIVLARPISSPALLPDQKTLNSAINSGESASKIFSVYKIEDLNEIQTYGLLSKWAIAVLARDRSIKVSMNLSVSQKNKINKLFDGNLKITETESISELEIIAMAEDYAKKIIQYSPY